MRFILALDQGTTNSRAIIFDQHAKTRAVAQRELRQIYPHPGWVEHDANEIWSTQATVINEALLSAGLEPSDIAAVGITNQRETTILWDRLTGEPLYHAIVWQDRRTAELCAGLKAQGFEKRVREKTGLGLDPYFSGTKLSWLLENLPGVRDRALRGELAFGTVDTWLTWKLTNGRQHVTETTNASRTLLFNIHTGDWDDELLAIFGVPRAVLPEVRASSEIYADCHFEALRGVPIAGIAGDQQAALFGQACTRAGMAKNTYGTGCFLLLHTGDQPALSSGKLLTTCAASDSRQRQYALEGSVFVAGAVVQWLRDGLGIIRAAADVEPLAASVLNNGGVHFVPAFTGLGAPHWDPDARGIITGLTRGSTAAHIARAALESIAFQTADVLEAMRNETQIPLEELRVDGGASRNNFLMQFQADVLGVPVVRPAIIETTALGAAYLAGLALGYWKSLDEIAAHWLTERRFEPQIPSSRREEILADWRGAVQRARS